MVGNDLLGFVPQTTLFTLGFVSARVVLCCTWSIELSNHYKLYPGSWQLELWQKLWTRQRETVEWARETFSEEVAKCFEGT